LLALLAVLDEEAGFRTRGPIADAAIGDPAAGLRKSRKFV
jgi:hypothetical protein